MDDAMIERPAAALAARALAVWEDEGGAPARPGPSPQPTPPGLSRRN